MVEVLQKRSSLTTEEAQAVLDNLEAVVETMEDFGLTRNNRDPTAGLIVDPHDIESCEALLEAYFMQVTRQVVWFVLRERSLLFQIPTSNGCFEGWSARKVWTLALL